MLRGRFLRTSTFRLTLAYVAVFGASVLLLLGFIYWQTAQSISRQVDDTVTAEIDALVQHYRLEGLPGVAALITERTGPRNLNGALYLLADPAFRPIAGNVAAWPAAADTHGRWLMFPIGGDEAAFGRAQAIRLHGGYHLLVGRDTRALDHFQTLMIEAMAWAFMGTLLLGGGGGYVMSRRVLGRIDGITRSAERIMRGDIAHRIPHEGNGGRKNNADEYDRLVDTLNAMLDRIEALMDGVRTVANNVAHDLRSPLTRMRADLEQAVISGGTPEELRTTCESVMAEADALLVTFNALLSIAEAEAGVGLAAPQPVDLRALAEDVVDLYGPLAEDAGLTLTIQNPGLNPGPNPGENVSGLPIVTGSRELLFQALSNLLDNAIKYTPAPGRITVGVTPRPATRDVDLWIADSGPGIPDADRARVLDRFVRLDASRTSPGNGLGLSLVSAISRLHRATLTLEDAEPGLCVRLRLPAAETT